MPHSAQFGRLGISAISMGQYCHLPYSSCKANQLGSWSRPWRLSSRISQTESTIWLRRGGARTQVSPRAAHDLIASRSPQSMPCKPQRVLGCPRSAGSDSPLKASLCAHSFQRKEASTRWTPCIRYCLCQNQPGSRGKSVRGSPKPQSSEYFLAPRSFAICQNL